MNTKERLGKIQEDLDRRCERAARLLREAVVGLSLPSIIGEGKEWAIVGGVVRDCLLSEHLFADMLCRSWPDVDIAVVATDSEWSGVACSSHSCSLRVTRNRFGGLKLRGEHVGEIDLWPVMPKKTELSGTDLWLDYLGTVDFGLNAVAFTWPQCKVLVHHRWKRDLSLRAVESLAGQQSCRHLEPLRAVALAVKAGQSTGAFFALHDDIRANLQWLLSHEDDGTVANTFEYLRDKLTSGRWPHAVFSRFLQESLTLDPDEATKRAFRDVFSVKLQGRSAVTRPKRHSGGKRDERARVLPGLLSET